MFIAEIWGNITILRKILVIPLLRDNHCSLTGIFYLFHFIYFFAIKLKVSEVTDSFCLNLYFSNTFLKIMEVNGQNFENITFVKALEILRNNTHLALTVKTNIFGEFCFKNCLSFFVIEKESL